MFVLLSLFLSSKGFKYMYNLYEQIFEREREREREREQWTAVNVDGY